MKKFYQGIISVMVLLFSLGVLSGCECGCYGECKDEKPCSQKADAACPEDFSATPLATYIASGGTVNDNDLLKNVGGCGSYYCTPSTDCAEGQIAVADCDGVPICIEECPISEEDIAAGFNPPLPFCSRGKMVCPGCYDPDGDTYGVGVECNGEDCKNEDSAINPSVDDLTCDGVDNNCDGVDGIDADGDGDASLATCGSDCNDNNPLFNINALDLCDDGEDYNCDGAPGIDLDGDGYATLESNCQEVDCDDADPNRNPGLVESKGERDCDDFDDDCTGDAYDVDCDGEDNVNGLGRDCDDNDPTVSSLFRETYYDCHDDDCRESTIDDDADGDGAKVDRACDDFTPTVIDCADFDLSRSPLLTEIPCNGIDDDCNPLTNDYDGVADPSSCNYLEVKNLEYGDPIKIDHGKYHHFYVVDNGLNSVFMLDKDLNITGQLKWLDDPISVEEGPGGNIFVGNDGENLIRVYSQVGHLLYSFGEGNLQMPTDIVFDGKGEIFVADAIAEQVKVFSVNGEYLRSIGTPVAGELNPHGDGILSFPISVTIGVHNGIEELIVGDNSFQEVQIFNTKGEFLRRFGEKYDDKQPLVVEGRFTRIVGVEIDSLGRIQVLDSYHKQVQVFDRGANNFIRLFSSVLPDDTTTQNGNNFPTDMAILSDDSVWELDSGNKRIVQMYPVAATLP